MSIPVNEIRYVLMPSKRPVPGYETFYAQMYECWFQSWLKFRRDSGLDPHLHSDALWLTDEVGAIFWRGRCVGLSCFTFMDLSQPWSQDYGWFEGWTPKAMEGLKSVSTNASVCSLFTVHPEFTGRQQVCRWKDVVSFYCMLRFMASDAGVMAGALNLSRKVDDACGEGIGATVLERAVPYPHAENQDMMLVAYQKEKIWEAYCRAGTQEVAAGLWSRATYLGNRPLMALPPVDGEALARPAGVGAEVRHLTLVDDKKKAA